MSILRPYQTDAIESVRQSLRSGKKAPILVCPTGSGKTVMGSEIIRLTVEKGGKVLFLAHRAELISQTSKKLSDIGVRHEKITAGKVSRLTQAVQVASVQTLIRRDLGSWEPTVIITDECHLACAKSYMDIHARWPNALRLGLTATPRRADGKGLDQVYDDICMGPTVRSLQESGFLAQCRCFSHPRSFDASKLHLHMGEYDMKEAHEEIVRKGIMGNAIEDYKAHGRDMTAVVFCCTVEHAEEVAASFRGAGYAAEHVDGGMAESERKRVLSGVSDGRVKILVSVDLVSVGFDAPILGCAILLRPTQSLTVFLQQVGRILRPYPGKDEAVVLDHVGNVLRHGLLDMVHEWSLDAKKKKKGDKGGKALVWQCQECFSIVPVSDANCPECGTCKPSSGREELENLGGKLEEVNSDFAPSGITKKKEERDCQSRQDFMALGLKRGYKNPAGWAYIQMKLRNERMKSKNKHNFPLLGA